MNNNITLRFTTKWPYNVSSWIIARAAGSNQWSHVMAIVGDTAYEATMLHGCRGVPVDVAMHGVKCYQDMIVEVPDIEKSIQWAKEQIGKKYDFAGAFGIPFCASQDWNDDRKWWCSEHNFMMLGAGGLWVMDKNQYNRITPDDLYKCNYVKKQVVKK